MGEDRTQAGAGPAPQTLPDLLRPGLDIVFVGINPGLRSAQAGRYFAHPRNRFWPAANAAGVFVPPLSPETGCDALAQGIGFTDVVKRPSGSASEVRPAEFAAGALVLKRKLLEAAPKIVCFNGLTACENYLRYADPPAGTRRSALSLPPDLVRGVQGSKGAVPFARPSPGRQEWPIGKAAVFVVPSPSPANAAVSLDELTGWYRQVAELRNELRS